MRILFFLLFVCSVIPASKAQNPAPAKNPAPMVKPSSPTVTAAVPAAQPMTSPARPVTSSAQPRLDSVAEFTGLVLQAEQGDIMLIRPDGYRRAVTVRLIAVAAPVRSTRDITGQEPWGAASQQWLAILANQKKVRVEFDIVRTDKDRAYWGYVWLGDKLVNEEILREGQAILDIQVPNVRWVERLRAAQTIAREKHLGVWDKTRPLPQTPTEFLTGHTEVKAAENKISAALTIPAWKEGCAVGNRNSLIYRMPGAAGYDKAKTSKNAVFFAKEEDAQAAGFQPAAR